MKETGASVVDVTTHVYETPLILIQILINMIPIVIRISPQAEDEFVHHCAVVDTDTKPLRDCISYYNAEVPKADRNHSLYRHVFDCAFDGRVQQSQGPLHITEEMLGVRG